MDAITKAILNSSPTALNFVKTLLATPMLINPGFNVYKNQSALPFAIPIEPESHSQSLSAEVSDSLIIVKDNKKSVADNIAPGTWQWQISGYIPGIPELEPTNKYTPFVTLNTRLLKMAAEKGYVLKFKDIDSSVYSNVVIKQVAINTQKDCRNRTPITITLKEISVMENATANLTTAEKNATTEAGSVLGNALNFGITTGAKVTLDLATVML